MNIEILAAILTPFMIFTILCIAYLRNKNAK